MKISVEEANKQAGFKTKRKRITKDHKFNAAIQSASDKAKNNLKRIAKTVDPFADLHREISRMTSRDPFVRTH